MKAVYIAHPLGQALQTREENLVNARKWVAWAASQGNAPVADWITLASQWDESRREEGLAIDVELVKRCDEIWLCGGMVSSGMQRELDAAIAAGVAVIDLTLCGYKGYGHSAPETLREIERQRAEAAVRGELERAETAPRMVAVTATLTCGTCCEPASKCRCAAQGIGVKFDAGKLRYGLVDVEALRQLVEVLTYGAKRYQPDNWRSVEDWRRRYYEALMRHIEAWRAGETFDIGPGGSGMRHLAHAMCNVHFLAALDAPNTEKKT